MCIRDSCISDTEVQTRSVDILSLVTQDSVPLLCEYDIDDNENERSMQLKHTDKDCDDDDFTATVDGLIKHLPHKNEKVPTHETIEENIELLEMIAGYIAYRVRKKYPGKASKYGSVSYTHLDVYKRQIDWSQKVLINIGMSKVEMDLLS